MTKVLFVCMGNICRSPAAEGVFKKILDDNDSSQEFYVDSAGIIDYHAGEQPDLRMITAMENRGYSANHFARQVNLKDFEIFDYLVAADYFVFRQLNKYPVSPENKKKIIQMAQFLQNHKENEIPDPYYGTDEDFEYCLDLIEDAVNGFFNKLLMSNEKSNLSNN
jgi:protein-tyrosine phosphatase